MSMETSEIVAERVVFKAFRLLVATVGLRDATHKRNTEQVVDCLSILWPWMAAFGHGDYVEITVCTSSVTNDYAISYLPHSVSSLIYTTYLQMMMLCVQSLRAICTANN